MLESGVCGALIGTRALLGEGWDCPPVNCLVDLTVAATGVSVQQMRGRSLRLDPGDPSKLASNWDIVCVAPDLARGSADYARFVRKHLHLYAPADDGEIEAGPSHVHPELSPFAPPPASHFAAVNRAMLARAAARDEARERWRLGEPYIGADLRTLVVRRRSGVDGVATAAAHQAGTEGGGAAGAGAEGAAGRRGGAPPISQRTPVAVAAAGLLVAVAAAFLVGSVGLAGGLAVALAALGWAALRLRRAQQRLPLVLPLDGAARAVADAYRALGELSDDAAGSLVIEPRASGYLRVALTRAMPEESERFATALDELVSVADAPRYLVGRPLPDPSAGAAALLGRVLLRRPPFPLRHHPVPADLGRRKERAEAFARAWAHHLGPARLVFTQRTDEGRQARAAAAADDGGYETVVRTSGSERACPGRRPPGPGPRGTRCRSPQPARRTSGRRPDGPRRGRRSRRRRSRCDAGAEARSRACRRPGPADLGARGCSRSVLAGEVPGRPWLLRMGWRTGCALTHRKVRRTCRGGLAAGRP